MNRNLFDNKSCGSGEVFISGRFRPNGSGAVDNTLNVGLFPFEVTRTGVGAFKLKLKNDDTAYQVKTWGGRVQDSTPNGDTVQPTTETISTNGELNIQVLDVTGAATDLASASTTWVQVDVVLKNTMVQP